MAMRVLLDLVGVSRSAFTAGRTAPRHIPSFSDVPARACVLQARDAAMARTCTPLVERDEDLSFGAALLDVGQRLEGLVEWECLVDDRAEVAGFVEGGQF